MPKLFEKAALLAAFILATAIVAATSAAAEQSVFAGANDITITEDMVGKTLEDVKGTCSLIISAFVYDTKTPPAKLSPIHIYGDPPYSQKISEEMAGKGLRIVSAEDCKLATSSFVPYLKKASRLVAVWNLISVSGGMSGKPLNDVKGTCSVQKARIYSQAACASLRADEDDPSAAEACDGDFIIIAPDKPIDSYYKGKGLWVKVASDCTLHDTPSQALCSEAECAAKSGCYDSDYVTYGCKDNSCAEISRPRACTTDEKAALGVDLVPRAKIKPATVPSLAQMEAGDEAEIAAYIGNEGTLSTTVHAIEKQQLSYTVKIAIEKISADGKTATPVATEYKAVSMVDKDIPPQGEVKVMSFVWKPATEGSYKVKIAVDINKEVTEAGEASEANNEKSYELVVKPASARLPNLVVGEGKISVIPKVLCRPATVSTITATVKNIGRTPANAQDQFLEAKVYVKEGSNVICSSLRMQNPPRWLVTINPGEEFTFMNLELTDSGGGECILQLGKDYVAAVDVDTLKAVTESNEDNTFSAPIVDETKCEEAATRQGNCYCDFDKKPKTQRKAFEVCSHNFECNTELCIKQKCVSETQKKDILKILGIG